MSTPIIDDLKQDLAQAAPQLTEWRRKIHAYPELALEEYETAKLVAEALRSFGLDVTEGVGGTGVVATVRGVGEGPSLGLRADTDALPMDDESGKPYRSRREGCAHACGHDGHTVALLGAAWRLARRPPPRGTVHLIFQPGEETGEGAEKMLEDGLFEHFPCDEIYAFHNMPLLPKGTAGMRVGTTLSSDADFDITIEGVGGHAAAPHTVIDPIKIGAHLVNEIASLAGRILAPSETAAMAVGRFDAGTARNIIPAQVRLEGIIRTLATASTNTLIEQLRQVCDGYAKTWNATVTFEVLHSMRACVNAREQVDVAAAACADILGSDNVRTDIDPYPFADDFALMLDETPGAYFFLGVDGPMCHHPTYDFDDELLPTAASIFVRIVERRLTS